MIWGTDAVHGHGNVYGATLFPHNIGLGAAADPELMRAIGEVTAREVALTGIEWIFAPTVAIAKDNRWGRTYESYSDQGPIVEDYAGPIISGIQSQGLIATAKHFIGDGGTFRGIDQGDTLMDLDVLIEEHGAGFKTALDADVLAIMASFNGWNGEKVHGNKQLLTDLLKGEWGFKGMVVSDWNGIGQVKGCTDDSCPQAINAGIDMVMAPEKWKSLYHNMIKQIEQGQIPVSRIDDAVRRILRVKIRSGALNAAKPSERQYALHPDKLGSDEHRLVAREAVRKSLVLLKNNDQLLPLDPSQNVLVAGKAADDIGMQSGGWTLSWQGTGNTNEDFPGATSIFAAIKEQTEAAGGKAILSPDGDTDEDVDVAIFVFGETPYAEGRGDIDSLAWQQAHAEDLNTLKSLRERGIAVLSIFITGRPLWMNREINASDAFVVAWLPGSEGAGIADVIFKDKDGATKYDFQGRLSFDWPNADINAENPDLPVTDILFPIGYGLNYSDTQNLGEFEEQPKGQLKLKDIEIFRRGSRDSWQLYLEDELDSSLAESGFVSSATGRVSVQAIDYQVQGDARHFSWQQSDEHSASLYWRSETPLDLTALTVPAAAINLNYRLDSASAKNVKLVIHCGDDCLGEYDLGKNLEAAEQGEWTERLIPFSCFKLENLVPGKIETLIKISVQGSMDLSLAEVVIVRDQFLNADCQ